MAEEERKRIDRIEYTKNTLKALDSNNVIPQSPEGTAVDSAAILHKATANSLQTLRTFESDTAELIERQKQSTFSIQQAEEKRRAATATTVVGAKVEERKQVFRDSGSKNSLLLLLSALFILIGTGSVLYFLILKDKQANFLPPSQIESLYASQYETVIEDTSEKKGVLREKIAGVVLGAQHEVGSIEHIKITEKGSGEIIDADELLLEIAEDVPPALLRSLIKDSYMVGTVQHERKEPFIIFNIELYENAFSNMLTFEPSLANIFDGIISKGTTTSIPVEPVGTTTMGTSTASTPVIQSILPPTLTKEFRDALVKNRDVRLIRDVEGNSKVLYSFYDEQTLIITTNESAFSDILNLIKTDKLSR
ncbi:MAG TPA: hypothetical protein PLF31_01960 [Candidatus Paceibacterota bacterium]|nr:hypothetical protein [Candidatus Paceibacterota bacterium]